MDTLQATHDFITGYDLPPTDMVTGIPAKLLNMIDEESEVFAFEDDLDHRSEDNVSLDMFSAGFASPMRDDKNAVTTTLTLPPALVAGSPWPEVSTRPRKRRRATPRKDEITDLKRQAAALSRKLDSLKASSVRAEEQSAEENALRKSLWEDIASRQLTLRRKTQADNMDLRNEVVFQVKMATNLRRMLRRRYSEEMLEMMPIMKRGIKVARETEITEEQVFRELLQGVDRVYAGVDDLLATKGSTKLPCPGRTKEAYPDTVNGLFFELADKNLVPFGASQTATAVWKAAGGGITCAGAIVEAKLCAQETQLTDNVVTSTMHYACNAAGNAAIVQENRVGRKYVEADRVVFVSRTLIEPSSQSLGSLGLLFQETLVTVVRKGSTLPSGEETAIIESYLWVTRCDDGKEAAVKFREEVFVDIAIAGWNAKMSLHSERTENILFDGVGKLACRVDN